MLIKGDDYHKTKGSSCLETGAYLLNFAGCYECKRKGFLKEDSKVTQEDDDGEETVTYDRKYVQHEFDADILSTDVCKECNHIIASHEYTFSVDDGFQVLELLVYYHGDLIKQSQNNMHDYLPMRCGHYQQEYSMNCSLCGYASATVSVLPDDPREKQLF